MTGLLPTLDRVIGLSGGALDQLMPMHLWIDADARIVQAGPTLTKMVGQGNLTGKPMFEIIELRRPARIDTVAGLTNLAGQRLGLALVAAPHLPLRGALAVLPAGAGIILDISLGLSFAKAVAGFGLTLNDFSPCDQTVELLYLHEANAATMALSRHLTRRLETARAMAEAQAMTDPLTGLANRRAMDAEIARVLGDHSQDFGLMQIDLDLFKQVNDSFGHAAGDAVLERVGHVLRQHLRLGDMAARVGGDEFTALIRDCAQPEDLARIAARLIEAFEVPVIYRGQACRVSASIGIAAVGNYSERPTLERLMSDADEALYAAKRAGRGRYALHAELTPIPVASAASVALLRRRADDAPPGGFRRRQNDRVPRPD
jgi:diguanylate cyclase (GGDEF)-like protein